MSWARTFGTEWSFVRASSIVMAGGMQLAHSVHSAYGFPTYEFCYGSGGAVVVSGGKNTGCAGADIAEDRTSLRHRVGAQRAVALQVRGDDLTVVRWMQSLWRCQQAELRGLLE